MQIRPPNNRIKQQLKRYALERKFKKQLALFEINLAHPSLNSEKLEPKHVGLYSFRIDKKFRAVFRIRNGEVEIILITKHYQK